MCGRKLKTFLLLSVLVSLLSVSPCFSEVVLTDEEAEQMLQEMEESKKELENVKQELEDVRITSTEQKKSYEEQLKEADEKNSKLTIWAVSSSTVAGVLLTVLIVLLL